jgi:hypothetical protein
MLGGMHLVFYHMARFHEQCWGIMAENLFHHLCSLFMLATKKKKKEKGLCVELLLINQNKLAYEWSMRALDLYFAMMNFPPT